MPNREQFSSTVVANQTLCREHYRLILSLPDFPQTFPGQFIQIACRGWDLHDSSGNELEWGTRPQAVVEGVELVGPEAFLRRPFSLAGRKDKPGVVELEIIHRVVGIGTDWLSNLKPGDDVNILGPLGNRFELPQPGQTAVLIGGGVGIPPMLYLSEHLKGREMVAFCGATTRDLLALTITSEADLAGIEPRQCVAEFSQAIITTDDGSYGFRGFVTQALERWLDTTHPRNPILYTCGPEPMMKRVAEIALARHLPCQIAVERAMACGMGTCQSCCIKVKKPDASKPPLVGNDWCYRLACTDGPVFSATELLW